jgi:hypothetical protein
MSLKRNAAATYFSIFKAALKQAFIDGYLTVDLSAKTALKNFQNLGNPLEKLHKVIDFEMFRPEIEEKMLNHSIAKKMKREQILIKASKRH